MAFGNCTVEYRTDQSINEFHSNRHSYRSHVIMETLFPLPKLPVVVIYYPEAENGNVSTDDANWQTVAEDLAERIAGESNLLIELKLRPNNPSKPLGRQEDFDLAILLQTNKSISEWQHGFEPVTSSDSPINFDEQEVKGSPAKFFNVRCEEFKRQNRKKDSDNWIEYYNKGSVEKSPGKIIQRIRDLLKEKLAKKQINVAILDLEKDDASVQLAVKFKDKIKRKLRRKDVVFFQDTKDLGEAKPIGLEAEVITDRQSHTPYIAKCIVVLRTKNSAETVDGFLESLSKVRGGIVVVNLGNRPPNLELLVPTYFYAPSIINPQSKVLSLVCDRIEHFIKSPITVFIAYSHRNAARMFSLKNALRLSGFNVLVDQRIRPGADWTDEVYDFMILADAVVGLGSDKSRDSVHLKEELEIAKLKNHLVPVYLDGKTPSPEFKRFKQFTELGAVQPFNPALCKIQEAILTKCRRPRALVIHDHECEDKYFADKHDQVVEQTEQAKGGTIVKHLRFSNREPVDEKLKNLNMNLQDWIEHQIEITRSFPSVDESSGSKTDVQILWSDSLAANADDGVPTNALTVVGDLIQANALPKDKVTVYLKGATQGRKQEKKDEKSLPAQFQGIDIEYLDDLDSDSTLPKSRANPSYTRAKAVHLELGEQQIPIELPAVRFEGDRPLRIEFPSEQLRQLHPKPPWYRKITNTLLPISALIGAGSLAYLAFIELPRQRGANQESANALLKTLDADGSQSLAIVDSIKKNSKQIQSVSTQLASINATLGKTAKPPVPTGGDLDRKFEIVVGKLTEIKSEIEHSSGVLCSIEKKIVDLLDTPSPIPEKLDALLEGSTQINENTNSTSANAAKILTAMDKLPNATQVTTLVTNAELSTTLLKSILVEIEEIKDQCGDTVPPGTGSGITGPSTEAIHASFFYYTLGKDAFTKGNYQNTIAYLSRAIELNPRDPRFYIYRGLARKKQGSNLEASQDIQIAAGLERKSPAINLSLAIERIQGPDRLWIEKIREDPATIPVLGSR